MLLSSLPLDVLLSILQLTSTRDVIRLGMTCKTLLRATQEHHVWLEQVQNWLRQIPSLRLLSLSIDSLSTDDLCRFAIRQAKLRICWDQPPNPVVQFTRLASFDCYGSSCLLPGGSVVLWASKWTGDIELYHTDPQVRSHSKGPFWMGSMGPGGWVTVGLIQTILPQPVVVYFKPAAAVLITVDERGEITPVVSLTLPERTLFTHCHGQERLVCFRTRHVEDPEYCFITVVHLDYPTTNLRMDIPDVVDLTLRRFDICLPCPDLLVILDRDEFRIYRLPDFSTLGPGTHNFEDSPIYSLNDPFKDVSEMLDDSRALQFVDQAYDPFSAPSFNLHLRDLKTGIRFTFTIDPSSPGHQATPVLHGHDVDSLGIPCNRDHIPSAKGLSYDMKPTEQGPVISVLPLTDTGRQNERGVLKFYAPKEVLADESWWTSVGVDVDEGSGRVLVKCFHYNISKVDLFVAELV